MSVTSDPANLDRVFKAYDVRGLVPDQLDDDLAARIGWAFVRSQGLRAVAVGHDMRPSSPGLAAAFGAGAATAGAEVRMLGYAATDQVYFVSGRYHEAGAMVTASHNPARYNGVKLCGPDAAPIGQETGLLAVREAVTAAAPIDLTGHRFLTHDALAEYAEWLRRLSPIRGRGLRVVLDAGNGMAGLTGPAVLGDVVQLVGMYLELDGTFPHHEANPIDPATLTDLQARVLAEGADVGLAFDGDADRCVVVDEAGRIVSASAVTALIAERLLRVRPGSPVIHNVITSRSVPETIRAAGGVPVRTRVGHSFIKAEMAASGAVFGGEHSGHYYFADFWRADCGMLAALHVLAALAEQPGPLSGLVAGYERYAASGEVNSTVADAAAALRRIEVAYAGYQTDHLDGLTVEGEGWWFNVRSSNTEPLLRLNVEGDDVGIMSRVRDDVLSLVRDDAVGSRVRDDAVGSRVRDDAVGNDEE